MSKYFKLLFLLAFLALILFPLQGYSETTAPSLSTHFIDVWQGDSIYVSFPDGHNMLIDAGDKTHGEAVVKYLQKCKVRKLDYLVITHPHDDHIGGLTDVINSFQIGKVYAPKTTHTSHTYKNIINALKGKGLRPSEAKAGQKLLCSNTDKKMDLEVTVLSPSRMDYDNLNDYSIILKVRYGKRSFLFTGDAAAESERDMLGSTKIMPLLKADILKVGHHGSKTSSTPKFLKAVSPSIAVISVGKDNDYGHPTKETLERLEKIGAKIYRTDKQGNIVVTTGGNDIKILTEK